MNVGIRYQELSDLPKELRETKYLYNQKILFKKPKTKTPVVIKEFGRINFFIGANNSGKSRFLRGLFKLNDHQQELFLKDYSISVFRSALIKEANKLMRQSMYPVENVRTALNDLIGFTAIQNGNSIIQVLSNKFDYKGFFEKHSKLMEITTDYLQKPLNNHITDYLNIVRTFAKRNLDLVEEIKFHQNNIHKNKVYIPVLRYANVNSYLKQDSYSKTIEENYGIESGTFTGLDFYNVLRKLQGEKSPTRKKKKEFESFLSKTFFDNKDVVITASSVESNKIYFEIDGDEKYLFDLGDGLQSIILLMFPLFNASDNDWIFIDEPENHLHPGFQKIFLKTILENEIIESKNLKLFITTHSNHFLDKSIINDDICIFQFEKVDKENIKICNLRKPSKETLDILGVSNSSVLIANSSIWVEGPTDRLYLGFWLNKYAEKLNVSYLIEDIDFAFFEYGGSLLSHYLFDLDFVDSDEIIREKINAFASANKIYLLADNDNASGTTKKGKRRKELEKSSLSNRNFRYQNTEVREIENLIDINTILGFAKTLLKNESDFNRIKDLTIKQKDYEKIGLGKYYEDLFVENGIPKSKHLAFKSKSETLTTSYKFKLCEYVTSSDLDFDNLTMNNPLLERIVKELYDFIKS
ncbi:MAG: AAA family ATPase [Bacteroidota bacterium]